MARLWFVTIHPFDDGSSGRIAQTHCGLGAGRSGQLAALPQHLVADPGPETRCVLHEMARHAKIAL